MSESFSQFVAQMFAGPVWPASILVGLMIGYTLLAVFGWVDVGFEVPVVDSKAVEADRGADRESDWWTGWGAATVHWTHFGQVPSVIWIGIFAVAFWTVSFLLWHGFDSHRFEATLPPSLVLATRNAVIATAIAKTLTQPLVQYHAFAASSRTGRRLTRGG